MSFLTSLWAKVVARMGSIGRYFGLIAEEIEIALKEKDVAKMRAASAKAREKAMDVISLCDTVDEAIADNSLDLIEGSQIALKIEAIVD
jgi:hypothetical protein